MNKTDLINITLEARQSIANKYDMHKDLEIIFKVCSDSAKCGNYSADVFARSLPTVSGIFDDHNRYIYCSALEKILREAGLTCISKVGHGSGAAYYHIMWGR